ncbi:TadE family type IV pilus minor pilin [Plantactinospora siamensis]|uniref:TadE family type IV pilus minor pilin n=1 Tax=Plantactinospora siamensis TaxID=555372 RepID=A0ABV6NVP2_9ACTN
MGPVGPGGRSDRGSFTAELAAGLPALLLLLLTGLTAVEAVTTKGQCLDAAREAALAASRGQDADVAAGDAAPAGATVQITVVGDRVRVTVEAPVRVSGTRLPEIRVTATAVAGLEPGAPEPPP